MEAFFEITGLLHVGLQIFEYLDPKSLGNCRLVNQTWCGVITEERFWAVARLDLLKLKIELEAPKEILQRKWKFWSKMVEKVKKEQSKDVLRKTAFFLDYQFKLSDEINDNKLIRFAIERDPWIGIEQLLINGETEFAKMVLQWLKENSDLKTVINNDYGTAKVNTSEYGLYISCRLGLNELSKFLLLDPLSEVTR